MSQAPAEAPNENHDSSSDTAGDNKDDARPANLMKRRKRISRACDECRRKKIRCDGKQPCTHCTVYSYECTYDQPSNRRRNHAPQYVENLEHRVHRAETLLHILIPNLDLNDPGIDAAVAQGWIPGAPGKGAPSSNTSPASGHRNLQSAASSISDLNDNADTNLPSMIRAVAQIDIDENGNLDYHGHSSGLSFMHRMREHLGDLLGPIPQSTPFVKSRPRSQVHDSPRSAVNSPSMSDTPYDDLPPRDVARQYCANALDVAVALLRLVHGPTFWASFDRLYAIPQDQWSNEEHKFLPLMFSAMATGCLFGRDATQTSNQHAYESAIQQGFTYFKSARQLMDIADCRDMQSVQAVVFMILFMQSTSKLSQCYAYIGVALRSAVRMGLHRSYTATDNVIEAETRKRLFWVIRSLDIYVGAMLGLPQTLSDDDIDQDLPAEVDDEYITKDGILSMPEGSISLLTAFNAHTRLVTILQKIVRTIYPVKVQSKADKSYTVPYSAIREIEADLERWKDNLHQALRPSDAPSRLTRAQQTLRLTYAHAQVLLYRPFLHFVNTEKRSKAVDQRAYACAASYVNVSRNIVHITTQMRNKGLLNGAFWFVMYTSFFSILSLVYFAAENPDSPTTEAILHDALEGKEVLASLASRSMAADRCTVTLDGIFSRLPSWMREGKPNPTTSRKRQHTHPSAEKVTSMAGKDGSSTAPSSKGSFTSNPARSNTFPAQTSVTSQPDPFSYGSWQTNGSVFGDANAAAAATASSMGVEFGTPSSTSTLASAALPPNFANPALPDVSAMMFPAGGDEPFNYPNQPLTTFESNHLPQRNGSTAQLASLSTSQPASFSQTQMASPATIGMQSGVSLGGKDDNLEAQLFALPPYMQANQANLTQQSQQTQQPLQRSVYPMDNASSFPGLVNNHTNHQMARMSLMNGTTDWQATAGPVHPAMQQPQPQQQQSYPQDIGGMYIQELFGGTEWSSLMH